MTTTTDTAAITTAWEKAIADLDQALKDASDARQQLADAEADRALMEAEATIAVGGPNAEARKAAVTVTLSQSDRYQARIATIRGASDQLRDAERRATVSRERCRLLRATLDTITRMED